ncbi:MAG: hypothetical protein IPL86_19320 [Flavobacteriales bacterium]|nr:hypothetical protein [Flavobacteriales bacterium]
MTGWGKARLVVYLSALFAGVTWESGGIFSFAPAGGYRSTVAELPGTGIPVREGHVAFATNGRKSGEGAGTGTGVPVYRDGISWLTYSANVAVTA